MINPAAIRTADSRIGNGSGCLDHNPGDIASHNCISVGALLSWILLCYCGVVAADSENFNSGYDKSSSDGENPSNIDYDLNQSSPSQARSGIPISPTAGLSGRPISTKSQRCGNNSQTPISGVC